MFKLKSLIATIWDVISKLHGEELSNIDNPVIIFTRTEICGQQKMQDTTLRSLGLTKGGAMLRYLKRTVTNADWKYFCFRFLNRTEDQLRTQANVSAPIPKMPRLPSPVREYKSGTNVVSSLKSAFDVKKEDNEPEAGPSTSTWVPPTESSKSKIEELNVEQEKPKAKEIPARIINPELEAEIEKELIVVGFKKLFVWLGLIFSLSAWWTKCCNI